jgi:RNA-binding protein
MLDSKSRSYLTGLASTKPAGIHLGKQGPTEALAVQLATLLERHELVKLKFVDFKDEKKTIAADLADATASELVRVIGNMAIFYKKNPDPEKRTITLP